MLDFNKLNIICEIVDNHLKENDEYKFAGKLTPSEVSHLSGRYKVDRVADHVDLQIWSIRSKL